MVSSSLYCIHCGAENLVQATFCYACGKAIQPPGNGSAASGRALLGVGVILKQRYQIVQQIGSGGFGAVYKAEDIDLGNRLVAVKEMSQHNLSPEEITDGAQAFKQEALLLAALLHEHLPRIYDHFSESGRWYLVMDYISGQTLEDYLAQIPDNRLPLDESLGIGLQLCSVLDYLHMRQPSIIFRDLKPSNVILTPEHQIFLIDFGIARHFKPGQAKDTIAFGSPGYAPPEQYGKSQTTPRADIYSLGAILHQMLSGTDPSLSPFRFGQLSLNAPALQQLLERMLDLDESKRPANMSEVKREMQRIKDQPQLLSAPANPFRKSISQPHLTWLSNGSAVLAYEGHASPVHSVDWSRNSAYIASASNEIVRVWDVRTGHEICTYQEHLSQILDMSWVPNTMHISSLGRDNNLRIWDVNTGRTVDVYTLTSKNGTQLLAWSQDTRFLALAGRGKTIELLDMPQRMRAALLSGYSREGYTDLTWSPDGKHLAASHGEEVLIWQVDLQKIVSTYRHSARINAVAWSPDGQSIASGGYGKIIQIWNASTRDLISMCSSGQLEQINTLAWSPKSHMVASGSILGNIQIWNARTGQQIASYSGHRNGILSLVWSPNGRYLASGGADASVYIWEAPSSPI